MVLIQLISSLSIFFFFFFNIDFLLVLALSFFLQTERYVSFHIFFELSRITMNLLQILELNVIHYLTKQ
jgi:hypothetical protein